jgi:hypothetical protein
LEGQHGTNHVENFGAFASGRLPEAVLDDVMFGRFGNFHLFPQKSQRLFHSGSKPIGCLSFMGRIVPVSGQARNGTLFGR